MLGGDVDEGEEFKESLAKIRFKCKKIASLVLPLELKIQHIHEWVYPALCSVATVIVLPKKILVCFANMHIWL